MVNRRIYHGQEPEKESSHWKRKAINYRLRVNNAAHSGGGRAGTGDAS